MDFEFASEVMRLSEWILSDFEHGRLDDFVIDPDLLCLITKLQGHDKMILLCESILTKLQPTSGYRMTATQISTDTLDDAMVTTTFALR